MKEYLASLVKQTATPIEGKNLVREYMQARILQSLQRAGAMIPLAFHGGTALRFLYASQRYLKTWIFPLWVMKASTISMLIYDRFVQI